ncbi:hypothetical protein KCU61_g519, partial [Aureobasidium melanogenum]
MSLYSHHRFDGLAKLPDVGPGSCPHPGLCSLSSHHPECLVCRAPELRTLATRWADPKSPMTGLGYTTNSSPLVASRNMLDGFMSTNTTVSSLSLRACDRALEESSICTRAEARHFMTHQMNVTSVQVVHVDAPAYGLFVKQYFHPAPDKCITQAHTFTHQLVIYALVDGRLVQSFCTPGVFDGHAIYNPLVRIDIDPFLKNVEVQASQTTKHITTGLASLNSRLLLSCFPAVRRQSGCASMPREKAAKAVQEAQRWLVLGKKLGGGKLTDPLRVVVRVTEPAPVFHSLGRGVHQSSPCHRVVASGRGTAGMACALASSGSYSAMGCRRLSAACSSPSAIVVFSVSTSRVCMASISHKHRILVDSDNRFDFQGLRRTSKQISNSVRLGVVGIRNSRR